MGKWSFITLASLIIVASVMKDHLVVGGLIGGLLHLVGKVLGLVLSLL